MTDTKLKTPTFDRLESERVTIDKPTLTGLRAEYVKMVERYNEITMSIHRELNEIESLEVVLGRTDKAPVLNIDEFKAVLASAKKDARQAAGVDMTKVSGAARHMADMR